jgi:hypothetical protein
MRRLLLATALLAALLAAAPTNAYKVGISDQQSATFGNPLYSGLKLGIARYIAPYDVMSDPTQEGKLQAWLSAARAHRQRVLIHFEHSRLSGQDRRLPSVAAYTRALKRFKAKYGSQVEAIGAWNEVNRKPVRVEDHYEGQPTYNNPKRAAQYYMAARKVFTGKKIVALDILDENDVRPALRYIKKFLKYAKPHPKYWGLHNYSDTNRGSTKRTKAVLKATKKGEVWLTETGGIVALGSSFPFNELRAAKALGCMFSLAKSNRRVTRLYIYQFYGAPQGARFDAGLVDYTGGAKRPGWEVVRTRRASRC